MPTELPVRLQKCPDKLIGHLLVPRDGIGPETKTVPVLGRSGDKTFVDIRQVQAGAPPAWHWAVVVDNESDVSHLSGFTRA